ncbi:hypothetical protein HK104_000820 [Borealophlyctis nickersoniae]|nr:hypothetical protein HK104_000820 [Borealophlyctis nickersoniae]
MIVGIWVVTEAGTSTMGGIGSVKGAEIAGAIPAGTGIGGTHEDEVVGIAGPVPMTATAVVIVSGRKGSDRDKKKKKKSKRETSEERRQRKEERKREKELLKKELRAQKESQIAAQMSATLGYSNQENPFGDTNLTQKFVWVKKREQEAKHGITMTERMRRDFEKKEESRMELEKLKKRRAEREVEQQLREQEQARMQREQDQQAMGDWEQRENDFHLEQAKTRAQIRIREGRAKPIDILAMNISLSSDSQIAEEFDALGLEMDVDEPYLIFQNLSLDEVEELHKDIQLYLAMEKDETNRKFWQAMVVVCEDELDKHRAAEAGTAHMGVNKSVIEDIESMFRNKTHDQLTLLQKEIEKKLRGDGPVDIEYWEAAIKALIVWKAKARLRDMHGFMLMKRLERLREKQKEDAGNAKPAPRQVLRYQKEAAETETLPQLEPEEQEAEESADEYDGSMSPIITREISRADQGLRVVTEEEDAKQLAEARNRVLKSQLGGTAVKEILGAPAPPPEVGSDEAAFLREAAKNMGMDEEIFEGEEVMSTQTYMWQDKYRPRKPRYLNRVHTGYEWNKYNQTHYDSDNPPPKVVQGYKFNIFYPDLIDKTKTPTYVREKDSDPDTCILRFKAGPPYEDIAFRIVNREWEYSHKKGFRSSFDRGSSSGQTTGVEAVDHIARRDKQWKPAFVIEALYATLLSFGADPLPKGSKFLRDVLWKGPISVARAMADAGVDMLGRLKPGWDDIDEMGSFEWHIVHGRVGWYAETVKFLLEIGLDPDEDGLLGGAVWIGDAVSVRMLLDAGADVALIESAFIAGAVSGGNAEILEMLFQAGMTEFPEATEVLQENALPPDEPLEPQFADKVAEVVALLMRWGADPAVLIEGQVPVVWALGKRAWGAADVLMAYEPYKSDVPTCNLLKAVAVDDGTEVSAQLERGADLNAFNGAPLFVAVALGHEEMVNQLIDHGACPGPESFGALLHERGAGLDSRESKASMLRLLVSRGAKPDSNFIERTLDNKEDIILLYGLLPIADGINMEELLKRALQCENRPATRFLLDLGADVSCVSWCMTHDCRASFEPPCGPECPSKTEMTYGLRRRWICHRGDRPSVWQLAKREWEFWVPPAE